jgi:hypothetical protein
MLDLDLTIDRGGEALAGERLGMFGGLTAKDFAHIRA